MIDWSSALFSLGPALLSDVKKPLRRFRSLDSERRRVIVLTFWTPSQPNMPEDGGSSASVVGGGATSTTGDRENIADRLRGRFLIGLRSSVLAVSVAENVTLTTGLVERSGSGDDTAWALGARWCRAEVDARFAATASGRPSPSESGRIGVGDSGRVGCDAGGRVVRADGVRDTGADIGADMGRRSNTASSNGAPSRTNGRVGDEEPRPKRPSKGSLSWGLLGVTTMSVGGAGVMGRDTARGAARVGWLRLDSPS